MTDQKIRFINGARWCASALLLAGCLGGARVMAPPTKREVAASLDDRGADMAAFKKWSLARQTAILDRCEQQLRSPVAGRVVTVDDCERRIDRFLLTRDEALKMWKGQNKTLKLVLGLVEDDNGGVQ